MQYSAKYDVPEKGLSNPRFLERLSPTLRTVAELRAQGKSLREICQTAKISPSRIWEYRIRLFYEYRIFELETELARGVHHAAR